MEGYGGGNKENKLNCIAKIQIACQEEYYNLGRCEQVLGSP
jgi:hypothetical protein